MLEQLQALDRRLLLAINHAHTPALDAVMSFASDRLVWLPAYALLIGFLIYEFRKRAALLLPLLIGAVGLADVITSRLFKPYFARPRPCHELRLLGRLHLPAGCGGKFGFLSSHAANSMALAVFLLVALPAIPRRFKWIKYVVLGWAVVLSYSRMYLGAHYLTDVLGGALLGGLLGGGAASLYNHTSRRRGWHADPKT